MTANVVTGGIIYASDVLSLAAPIHNAQQLLQNMSSGISTVAQTEMPINGLNCVMNKFQKTGGNVFSTFPPFELPSLWDRGNLNVNLWVYGNGMNIDTCDVNWTAGSNVTSALDTSTYWLGSASVKLTVASAASAGQVLGYHDFSAIDLSGSSYIGLIVQSSVATNPGDLQLLIDNTSGCVSPVKSYDLPALAAGTATIVVISLDSMSGASAIISVGIKMVVDKGAFTLNVDGIIATAPVVMRARATVTDSGYLLPKSGFGAQAQVVITPVPYQVIKQTITVTPNINWNTDVSSFAINFLCNLQVYRGGSSTSDLMAADCYVALVSVESGKTK